jgi:hypothetical protein
MTEASAEYRFEISRGGILRYCRPALLPLTGTKMRLSFPWTVNAKTFGEKPPVVAILEKEFAG